VTRPPPTPISTDSAPKAIGPYSQAVTSGDLVFCSGQVALDPRTGQLVGADVAAQTRQVLDNLAAVLSAAGSGLDQVLKTTVFLASMDDFAAMNEVYATYFPRTRPARATVAVKTLPRNALVEIDCVAQRR
jgi:2-iminobutanoate/2-iminopropanoate deaminase